MTLRWDTGQSRLCHRVLLVLTLLANMPSAVMARPSSNHDLTLACFEHAQTPGDLVASRAQAMQQRRQDQEVHRHDQIWTKDSHGGPYRKVSRDRCQSASSS